MLRGSRLRTNQNAVPHTAHRCSDLTIIPSKATLPAFTIRRSGQAGQRRSRVSGSSGSGDAITGSGALGPERDTLTSRVGEASLGRAARKTRTLRRGHDRRRRRRLGPATRGDTHTRSKRSDRTSWAHRSGTRSCSQSSVPPCVTPCMRSARAKSLMLRSGGGSWRGISTIAVGTEFPGSAR
jgi:hypothetical protein